MDVRQVRPMDAPLVLSLALDESAHLVKGENWPEPHPIFRTLSRSFFPVALGGKTWIARDNCHAAILEAQPRRYVIGWDIVRLSAGHESGMLLEPLIGAALEYLQSRGVPRLFARCGEHGREALEPLEFQPLAHELVLVGPESSASTDTPLPPNTRYRMPQDAWPLHQLEMETTPPLIRQFEGLNSQDWSQRSHKMSELVVEIDGRIVAWIGRGTRERHGFVQVGMLLRPECDSLGHDLVHYMMRTALPDCRLVVRVREYHDAILRAFIDAGFTVVREETLMLKHAAVERVPSAKTRLRAVGVPCVQAFPFLLRVAPPLAKVETNLQKEQQT